MAQDKGKPAKDPLAKVGKGGMTTASDPDPVEVVPGPKAGFSVGAPPKKPGGGGQKKS